ncbi:uncharacterized protein LOC131178448 [Hevea brasiliensis]|uniref:uncharacterized protein LOC131178448 n=1 Tax=Hevea brasiliensis TaxID=3981 RepID=UPI0025F6FCDA|nr:uncharacterized protein LOC131178448 [Hevea brasiliensis]
MIQQSRFPIHLFFKLKILLLQNFYDASVNLPFNILPKFPNFEKLVLGGYYFRELFPHGVVGEDAGVLLQSQIRFLKLDFLPNIRHIWNQDCQPVPFLQNLETLEIWSCHRLTNLAPSSATFKNLTTLDVWNCQGLLSLISSSTAKSMVNLTKMIVGESRKMEEIVSNDRNDSQSQSEIVLCRLRTLKLLCLKSLSSFCSSANCTLKFPSLEELIVTQCPRMKIFSQGAISAPKLKRVNLAEERDKWRWIGNLNSTIIQLYTEKVGFSGLQHLELSEFPELKAVWQHKLPFNFFYNLSRLVVDECMFSSSSVPSGLLPFLNNLDELEVRNCNFVEEVFAMERGNANRVVGHLSKLNELNLINLPMLRRVWIEEPNGILDLRNLKQLKIHNCSSLRNIFSPTICCGLEQLRVVEVTSCATVEEIITEGSIDEIIFPLLNSITLESLPRLINFKSGRGIVHFPSLKEITIADCPTTFSCSFFKKAGPNATDGNFEPKVFFPNLEELKPIMVEMIWHAQPLEMFSYAQNLSTLTVDGCGNLKYLSSSSSVVHLKRLKICNCKMMEEVMVREGLEEEIMSKTILHQLEFLALKDLPKLTRFCTSDLVECHTLEKLCIQNCPEMRTFDSNSATSNMAFSSKLDIVNSALFNDKVSFPNLTTLIVDGCDNLKILLSLSSVVHLKRLKICNCKMMEEVMVKEGVEEEIMSKMLLHQLESLELMDLPKLTRFCTSNLVECPVLKHLRIQNCPQMRTFVSNYTTSNMASSREFGIINSALFDEKVAFPNLEQLEILNMDNLKNLLSLSSVVHLKRLQICNCKMMEEVMVKEGLEEEIMSKMLLHQLESLELMDLPKLTRFCTSNLVECPVLKHLRIQNCPQMRTFVSNYTTSNMASSSELDITNSALFDEKVAFPNLEQLEIHNMDNLKMIWHNKLHSDSFCKIIALAVENCEELIKIFSSTLLRGLRNLQRLVIRNCDLLQEVFDLQGLIKMKESVAIQLRTLNIEVLPNSKHVWNEDPLGLVLFDNLSSVSVWNCPNLKIIFPASIAKNLLQLKRLHIISSGVEEIVQNLNWVETNMENQPMVKVLQPHFSFRKLDQALQSLEVLAVWYCDNLITLAPSSASFQNLTTLEVWMCNGLVSLVTSSTAKSLVQLTKMSIAACDRLKEIVANEGNESKEDIIFSKLGELGLRYLPSLVSFCSAEHSFKFPSLTEVFIEKCPKMQIFSKGVLSTPRLLVVQHDEQGCWKGNLNDTVQQLFAEMVRMCWLTKFPFLLNHRIEIITQF